MRHAHFKGDLEMHIPSQDAAPRRPRQLSVYKTGGQIFQEPTLLPDFAGSAFLISSFASFFSWRVSTEGATAALPSSFWASPSVLPSTVLVPGAWGPAMFLCTVLPSAWPRPALCSINAFQVSPFPDDVVLKQRIVNIFEFFHEYFESCLSYPRQFWTNFEAKFYKTLHQMLEYLLFVIYFAKCLKCIYRRQASALMYKPNTIKLSRCNLENSLIMHALTIFFTK